MALDTDGQHWLSVGEFSGIQVFNEALIDSASETDGVEVISTSLGGIYSKGLLTAQDGRNVLPQQQNFKLVP